MSVHVNTVICWQPKALASSEPRKHLLRTAGQKKHTCFYNLTLQSLKPKNLKHATLLFLLMVSKWKPGLKSDLTETFPQRSPLLRNSFLSFLWHSMGLNLGKLVQVCILCVQAEWRKFTEGRLGLCPVIRLTKIKLNLCI